MVNIREATQESLLYSRDMGLYLLYSQYQEDYNVQ